MKLDWKKSIFILVLLGSILLNAYQLINTGISTTYTDIFIAKLEREKAHALLIINEFVPKLSEQEIHQLVKKLESKDSNMLIKDEDGTISSGEIIFKRSKTGYIADYYSD